LQRKTARPDSNCRFDALDFELRIEAEPMSADYPPPVSICRSIYRSQEHLHMARCMLAFRENFKFDCYVTPAENGVTSLSGIDRNTYQGAAFATTHWSLVLAAQGPTPAAQEALEKLCRAYWRPIYGFVRRQSTLPEEAKDLTQGFFALLLEPRVLL
jgi:hypothetical protein